MKKIILGLTLLALMTEKVYSEDQKILCLNLRSNEVYTIIDSPSSAHAKLSDDRCSNRTLNENGEVILFNYERSNHNEDYNKKLSEFLGKTYLSISLFDIIKDLIKFLGEDECSEHQNILSKDEAMILKLLKQDDISKIEITFNDKTKKAETIKVTKNNSVNNFSRVQDLILRNGYQDISIKTQKGKVVQCTNTTKYKLDTE